MVHEAVRPVAVAKTSAVPSLICCVALLAACAGGEESNERSDNRRQPTLPVPFRQAECTDWRKGSVDQRRGTVTQIREFAGGPVGSSQGIQKGRVLDDAQAYQLLDRYCSKRIARGFRLYLLYVRAAAFAGSQRNADPLGRTKPGL